MPTKFLFTWEETTLLNQELTKRKQSFLTKYWESGLFEWKWDEQTLGVLQNSLLWGWFFATKKLIIIHWIPKDSIGSYALPASLLNTLSSRLQKHREQIPDDHVVVLVSRKPDKRTSGYKVFSKLCQSKEFKLLSMNQRLTYAKKSLWTLLTESQFEYVVHSAWPTMWVLQFDLQKVKLYMEYNHIEKISDQELNTIVSNNWEDNAFTLLDLIVKKPAQAIDYIDLLRDQWWDPFQTLWMMYWWVKILIGMVDSWNNGYTSSKEIASRIKAPPSTVSKFGKFKDEILSKTNYRELLFNELIKLDFSIKTWKLPLESFWVVLKNSLLSQKDTEISVPFS